MSAKHPFFDRERDATLRYHLFSDLRERLPNGMIQGRYEEGFLKHGTIPEVDGCSYCAVTAGEYKRNCTACDDVGDRIYFFAAYIDIQNGELEISRFRKIQRDSNIARFRDDRVTQLFNHPRNHHPYEYFVFHQQDRETGSVRL